MKGILIIMLVSVSIIGLFIWGNNWQNSRVFYFENTDVACLNNGHQNLAFHIHPQIKITVDGQNEEVPANIGINDTCMSEVHTHDSTGQIHIESINAERLEQFTLRNFFDVWKQTPEREGYNLEIYFNGESKNSVDEISFVDHSKIELRYTSK
ncbi:hypothetical protein H6775_01545 [Candidatus Nomurabacteria bacterium]|nr:hypothetical protein [Candidatus Nomurabacteria bacterium]